MKSQIRVRVITVTLSMLVTGYLAAQNPSEDPANANGLPPVSVADPIQAQSGEGEAVQSQYVPALDGTGLIALDRTRKTHTILGGTFSTGWDSNPDNQTTGASSAVFTLSPYLGLQGNTGTTQYVLQYVPTFTRYSSNEYSGQTLQRLSARVLGILNDRWRWDVDADGTYGQDSLRLLVPPQSTVVGQIPTLGPNAAAYQANAGTVAYIEGGMGFQYAKSERDSLTFHVGNSYSHFSGIDGNNLVASTQLGYDRKMSPNVGLAAYGQMFYEYGSINCTSFGGGVGVAWTIRERTSLQLSGGPQLNSAACGNQMGFSFNAAFSTRLSRVSQVYVTASRQFGTYYLGPGLWQNNVSAGYQRQVGSTGSLNMDVGYARSDSLGAPGSYNGLFFDAAFSRQMGHGLSSSFTYRVYSGDSGGSSLSREIAMFSLIWAPNAGRIFR